MLRLQQEPPAVRRREELRRDRPSAAGRSRRATATGPSSCRSPRARRPAADRRTARDRAGTARAPAQLVRRAPSAAASGGSVERRLVDRVHRAVGDDQHAERFLRPIQRQRRVFDQPLVRRQLLLRAQRVQAAARPLLLELGRQIEMRPRRVARAVVPLEDAALRDDAQVRVRGRERDLPPRFGRASARRSARCPRACARRAQAAAATIGMSAVSDRRDLVLRRHGRALELHARVQRRAW